MSRSRRKTPIFGITTAESDKPYKRREHRRERSAVRDALNTGSRIPNTKRFGDPFASEKDGKLYWAGASEKDMRK